MKTQCLASLLVVVAVVSAATVSAAGPVRPRQVADLKSFFHGEPPPPEKAPPPKVTATVSFAPGVTPDKDVASFMTAFAEALKAREGRQLVPRLSDKYAIADLPEGHKAADFFAQAVDQTPGPTEIVILSIEAKDGVRVAKMEFRFPNKVSPKIFKFDAAGKLLGSDLFTLKRVDHSL